MITDSDFAEAVADALYDGARFEIDGEAPTNVDVVRIGENVFVDVTFPSEQYFRLQVVRVE